MITPKLTKRLQEVMDLTAQGMTAREISARLNIKASSAKTYRNIAAQRLGIKSKQYVTAYYSRQIPEYAQGISRLLADWLDTHSKCLDARAQGDMRYILNRLIVDSIRKEVA